MPAVLLPAGVRPPLGKPVAQGVFRKKALDDDCVPEVPTRRSTLTTLPAAAPNRLPSLLVTPPAATREEYFWRLMVGWQTPAA